TAIVQSGSRRGPEISDFWDNRSDVLNETTTSTRETVSPSARDERAMMSDRVVTGEVAGEGSSSYSHSDLVQS
ncbi:hypothetical protein ARMGADRAFT_1020797, partial [Armillaria gallica]